MEMLSIKETIKIEALAKAIESASAKELTSQVANEAVTKDILDRAAAFVNFISPHEERHETS